MDLKEAGYGLDRSGLGLHYRRKTCTRLSIDFSCMTLLHEVSFLGQSTMILRYHRGSAPALHESQLDVVGW